MKFNMRPVFLLAFIIIIFQPTHLNAEIIDRVVAAIGDEAITFFDLEKAGGKAFRQISLTASAEERERKIAAERKKVLKQLVEKLLLTREAKRSGITIEEDRVTAAIDNIRKQNSLSLEELKIALKRDGIDYESYREAVRGQILRGHVIERNVKGNINISDADIIAYYEKNKVGFRNDERVKARHILIMVPADSGKAEASKARKRARRILTLAKKGGDFGKLARKYSEGPSASMGGDLGFFRRGDMVKEFSDTAFSLKEGEVSGLVLTQFGFHIIKTEKKEGGSLLSFEEAKDKIRTKLSDEAKDRGIKAYIEELREKDEVDILI